MFSGRFNPIFFYVRLIPNLILFLNLVYTFSVAQKALPDLKSLMAMNYLKKK